MEQKVMTSSDEIIKIIKRQNKHLARISKNVLFFFWLTIAGIGFYLILWVYFSTSSSNDFTKERDSSEETVSDANISVER